jgi:hypothetical protein
VNASAVRPGWIVSPAFDVAFFIGPSVVALAAVALVPGIRDAGAATPIWGWVACVLLVDVAHVWSTIFRTYLDPVELARRRTLYVIVPALCFLAGVVLHAAGDVWFWRVLAYLAVIHFVRQQYGFVALYGRRGAWISRWDFHIDRVAVYSATLYPLVYWHVHGRPFAWFVHGDFVSLGSSHLATLGLLVEQAARVVWSGSLAAFALRQVWLAIRHGVVATGRILVVASTALIWWVGIVGCEADFAFTVTNCVAHGAPYLALVWVYNRRRCERGASLSLHDGPTVPRLLALIASRRAIPLFLGICIGLAWAEEALWDNIVWRERMTLFGDVHSWLDALGARRLLVFLVPLLALPQAVHYVLDAFIWKLDGSNPDLGRYLFPDGARDTGGQTTTGRGRAGRRPGTDPPLAAWQDPASSVPAGGEGRQGPV